VRKRNGELRKAAGLYSVDRGMKRKEDRGGER
jgi:hypothetical protein